MSKHTQHAEIAQQSAKYLKLLGASFFISLWFHSIIFWKYS